MRAVRLKPTPAIVIQTLAPCIMRATIKICSLPNLHLCDKEWKMKLNTPFHLAADQFPKNTDMFLSICCFRCCNKIRNRTTKTKSKQIQKNSPGVGFNRTALIYIIYIPQRHPV